MNLNIVEEFPYTDTVSYFNSSIINYEDRNYIFSRKGTWNKSFRFHDSIISCLKDGQLKDLELHQFDGEHIEDPRAFIYMGKICLSCGILNKNDISKFTQRVFVLNKDLTLNSVLPVKVQQQQKWEKNWTYFTDKVQNLFCIYSLTPYVVYNAKTGNKLIDVNYDWEWKYGRVSGGSNPILVDGLFYSFFHSSELVRPNEKKYYLGFTAFKPTPPFDIVRKSKTPIMIGSKKYGRIKDYPYKNYTIYPGGCIFEENNFVVSVGINDYRTALIQIGFDELVKFE